MADLAISMKGVSKRYEVFDTQRGRLMHALWPGYRAGMREIWALRDVDLEVRRGESVAVIGRNGGGKSTLLQILTGVLEPTSGEVRVDGRISALLELGSGFNPEYTGRDNVLLNGLLLGLSRDEILARFDEIASFAEIGEAIERPVKTYSSGMLMRLAFAVQVLTDPEILVIDEALSVGDFFFQQKCFARIRTLQEGGATILFVSHDMGAVRNLCSKALYLMKGEVAFIGDSQRAIRRYLADADVRVPHSPGFPMESRDIAVEVGVGAEALWRGPGDPMPTALLAVELLSTDGQPVTTVRMGDTVVVRVHFRSPPEEQGHVALVLKNRYDQIVTNVSSYAAGMQPVSSGDEASAVLDFELSMMLEAGMYSMKVALASPSSPNQGTVLDETGWIGPLRVEWDYESERAPFLGMFGLPVRTKLIRGTIAQAAGITQGAVQ